MTHSAIHYIGDIVNRLTMADLLNPAKAKDVEEYFRRKNEEDEE